jgi:dipeptidyl aminopeptidase/acylaminoacyl peptidase
MQELFNNKNSIVKDYFEIKLNKERLSFLKSVLSPAQFTEAKMNSKKMWVYKIVYVSNGHRVMGYLVAPRVIQKKIPCIIWNRGGSNNHGAIRLGELFIGSIANFVSNGYIVFASQYSGNDGGEGKDEFGGKDIDDVLNLYKIIRSCPFADASKIGMYGHSRGGLMTYLSLSKVKWIKAAVVIAGTCDEVSAPQFRKGWREHQIKMYGGSKEEQIKRSAVYWADKFSRKAPLLIMHGTADWRVEPAASMRLAEKLLEYKKPFRLVMLEGADHSLTEYPMEHREMPLDWFDRYLKNKEKLPILKPHGV